METGANRDAKELMQKIGYEFKNEEYLEEALTHRSYSNETEKDRRFNNEKLEFLGDAVLELTISDWLFRQFPHFQEGQLTKLRAQIVCEDSLSLLSKECSLNEYLLLGKGETLSGGREKPAILCDVFEAFIGALYLDKGVNEVQRYLNLVVIPKIKNGRYELITDFKTELQEYLQQNGPVHIRYELVKEDGPSHDKIFTVQLIVDGKKYKTASGKTKKAAEQMAAKLTMEELTKSSLS